MNRTGTCFRGAGFRTGCRCIAVMLCALLTPLAMTDTATAHDGGHDPGHHHPGAEAGEPSKIIWIDVPDREKLLWLIDELGVTPMACRPGPGHQRYHVSPSQLGQIEKEKLPHGVVIDDAEAAFEAERQRIAAINADRGASWFDAYKTHAQINDKIDDLVASYPNLVTKLTVGTSHEGRTIYGMKITATGAIRLSDMHQPPGVLFNGCQHAREWISPMTTMFIANELLTRYGNDAQVDALLGDIEVFIVPVVNPDGYEHTWNTYRLWRKNRRFNNDGTFGVDLNRNWNIDWNGGESTSTNPSSDVYVGPAPFSEPETQALRDFFLARPNIVAHIDFHSYSQLVLQAWGYTDTLPPDFPAIDALGGQMTDAIAGVHGEFYPHGSGGSLIYLASGTCSDWTYDNGAFGYTIELRPDSSFPGFELPPAEIIPTGEENFAAALAMFEWAATPLQADFPAGQPAVLDPGLATVINVDLNALHGETIDENTANLLYRTAARGGFQSVPMTHLGGASFQAELPAFNCGAAVEYYFQVDNSDGATLTAPRNAPTELFVADVLETVIDDNFETDLGWTTAVFGASSGQWQRGVPVNDPNWAYDPAADADGSGQCWLTQNTNGNSDVDNGSVELTSPALDMSGNPDALWTVSYSYYLYLSNDDGSDRLLVEANDGDGAWVQVALHDTHGGTQWRTNSITSDDLTNAGLTLTANMQLRFTANDSGTQSIVEAGLDGFQIISDSCDSGVPGDIAEPFGVVDVFDLLELLANWGADGPGADIADPTDVVDVFDLLELLSNWG